jgi:hypothetical protein
LDLVTRRLRPSDISLVIFLSCSASLSGCARQPDAIPLRASELAAISSSVRAECDERMLSDELLRILSAARSESALGARYVRIEGLDLLPDDLVAMIVGRLAALGCRAESSGSYVPVRWFAWD